MQVVEGGNDGVDAVMPCDRQPQALDVAHCVAKSSGFATWQAPELSARIVEKGREEVCRFASPSALSARQMILGTMEGRRRGARMSVEGAMGEEEASAPSRAQLERLRSER